MARYVFKDGALVDRFSGEPMSVPKGPLRAPMVMSDIPAYASPIDGRMITSRSERREDLKRNNCVPYEESLGPTKGQRKFRNPEFCRKRGLSVAEEFRQ